MESALSGAPSVQTAQFQPALHPPFLKSQFIPILEDGVILYQMDDPILLTILAIAALLVISALFSGSETALTAASKARIKKLASEGKKNAKTVAGLIDDQERLLGAILLGNNLVNILASALATSLLISLYGANGVVWATLIMTALVLVFAEVLPKTYAIANPDRMALAVAPVIAIVIRLLSPVVVIVRYIVRKTLQLFGVDISKANYVLSARDEIRGTIDLQESEGRLIKAERDMLGSILDLDSVMVEDVMVHRKSMVMANIDDPADEVITAAIKSTFSRIPVWQDTRENVVGIIHAKDILKALHRPGTDPAKLNLRRIMHKPWFVPETSTLREQLSAFLDKKRHFALVVDEYGAIMGLVTLEDILEEIVGDIADEHDIEATGVKMLEGNAILVDGDVSVRDLNRQMDWRLPDDEAITIAGLVINEIEFIPIVGESFRLFDMDFEIVARQKNQITKVCITPPEKDQAE
jgi:magnesium and cobalt exporter, CNNM family